MVAAIDASHESAEDAALAALAAAEEIFEKRAKFVVVGQVAGTREIQDLPPDHPEAIKLALGWYSTQGDADKAAESLWWSVASGDRFRTWVLPVHHGTPADLHAKRKAVYVAAEEKAAAVKATKLQAQIEKRAADTEKRAAAGIGFCSHCGHHRYDHHRTGPKADWCALSDCACREWDEKKK